MNILTKDNLQEIYHHSSSDYPNECCGFVHANGIVYTGTNIQDDLHKQNPKAYPRGAKTGYTFSVEDTIYLNSSLRTKNPVVIIYHSHPDVGAYFSKEDISKALYEGEPRHPVAYLVIDVRNGTVAGSKLFQWINGEFICTKVFQSED